MANIKPKALCEGSAIGVTAASSSFSKDNFYKGVEVLKSLGFNVSFNENIFKRTGYLAGPDKDRAGELNQLLNDPSIDAIMFARGGYGAQRIMPLLDFSAFEKRPKIIVGASDLTALTSYITSQLNIPCFYGPMVTALANGDEATVKSLREALIKTLPLTIDIPTRDTRYPSTRLRTGEIRDTIIKPGEARGRFIGGCLSLISSSIGTEYELKTDSSILFIEDRGERVYKYDRMLTHLKNSKILDGVNGIVFGSMGLDLEKDSEEELWAMVKDVLSDFKGPVVCGLSAGHISPFVTLPLGVGCRLVVKEVAKLEFDEAALI